MQICCQYIAKQIWRLEILVEKKYVNMEICKYWCKYWCKNKYEAMEICKYGDLYPLKMKNQGVKKNFNSCNNRCGGMWTTSRVLALNGDTNMKTSKRGKTIKKTHNEFTTIPQRVHNDFTTSSQRVHTISQRFHNKFTTRSQRFHNDFTTISQRETQINI